MSAWCSPTKKRVFAVFFMEEARITRSTSLAVMIETIGFEAHFYPVCTKNSVRDLKHAIWCIYMSELSAVNEISSEGIIMSRSVSFVD